MADMIQPQAAVAGAGAPAGAAATPTPAAAAVAGAAAGAAAGVAAAAAATTPPPEDAFLRISGDTWLGLGAAFRECSWIAAGGDPTATFADRAEATSRGAEYKNKQLDVAQRMAAYRAAMLSVVPPTDTDLQQAKEIATRLAQMRDTNVKVTAVVTAATQLLTLYNKTQA